MFKDGFQSGYRKGIIDGRNSGINEGYAKANLEINQFLKSIEIVICGCIPKGSGGRLSKAVSCHQCMFDRSFQNTAQRKICFINAEYFIILNKFNTKMVDMGGIFEQIKNGGFTI